MAEIVGFLIVLFIIFGLPAALVWVLVWAIRLQLKINALRRGDDIGNTKLDDLARRWHARNLRYRAKLDAARARHRSQLPGKKEGGQVPDRTPAEVDALRFAARSAMVRRERDKAESGQSSSPDVDRSVVNKPERQRPAPKPQGERFRSWRTSPGAPTQRRGRSARFTYVDEDGVVTSRQIQNWTIASNYIEGWCLDREDIRTFRLDRVEEWHGWT